MIGDHHIYNCLMATAIGLAEGIDLNTIVRGLETVTRVPGRLERIECGQPFGVFVDYAHTPDALACVAGDAAAGDAGPDHLRVRRRRQSRHGQASFDGPRRRVAGRRRGRDHRQPSPRRSAAIGAGDHCRFRASWRRPLGPRSHGSHPLCVVAGRSGRLRAGGRPRARTVSTRSAASACRWTIATSSRRYLYNLAPSSPYGGLQSVSNS